MATWSFAPARSSFLGGAARSVRQRSGGAPTAAAKTFSWALAPLKRKEEEGKEAAAAKADADDDEAAAADVGEGGGGRAPKRTGGRSRAPTAAAAAALDGALSEGGTHRAVHPLVESGDFDLLVHHNLGGEPPALVKATRLRVLPATIDVPEATLHGSGMHPCRFDAFGNVEREIMLTCRDAFGNRVPRVGLTIGTELAARLTSVDADGAAIEGAAAPTVVITDVGGACTGSRTACVRGLSS